MEIVDAQVHANCIGPGWWRSDPTAVIDATIAAMDAVGVNAVLIDEVVGWDDRGRIVPGRESPDGFWRAAYPFAEEAMVRHPKRFAYVVRVDHRDPEMVNLVRELREKPGRLALRVSPASTNTLELFTNGDYKPLFATADRHDIPIFMSLGGRTELLVRYLKEFPNVHVVIDHCGIKFPRKGELTRDWLDALIAFAKYPRVAVKWCHVESMASEPYPFRDVFPHIRRVLDAFGADRIMWASDNTLSKDPNWAYPRTCTWAEALYYLLDSGTLSEDEKEWVLGRTARTFLRWPISEAIGEEIIGHNEMSLRRIALESGAAPRFRTDG